MPFSKRMKRGTAIGAAMVGVLTTWEGVQLVAYPDPATKGPPWTVCLGTTHGVKRGDRYTMDQCMNLLWKELPTYAGGVEACIKRPMPDTVFVAFTSLAWNIGTGGFCRSSVARFYNEGRTVDACNALMRFNKAAGVTFRGLTRRRDAERQLCLQGADL